MVRCKLSACCYSQRYPKNEFPIQIYSALVKRQSPTIQEQPGWNPQVMKPTTFTVNIDATMYKQNNFQQDANMVNNQMPNMQTNHTNQM